MSEHVAMIELNKSGTGARLVECLRESGVPVTVVTKEPHRYPSLDGLEAKVLLADTEDPGAVTRLLEPQNVTSVVAAGDHYVAHAAQVAGRLKGRGLGHVVARLGRDKWRIHEHLRSSVRTPRSVLVSRGAEVPADIPLPCVVKPVDGTGSELVSYCEDQSAVKRAVEVIAQRTVNHRGQRRPGSGMISEFVDGPEFSIECLVAGGRTDVVGVTGKTLSGPNTFVEVGHRFPVVGDPADGPLRVFAEAIISALRIEHGALHIEARMTPQGPCLIEVNFRAAGDGITELVETSTGEDFIAAWADVVLGRYRSHSWTPRRVAIATYEPPQAGIDTIIGNDARGGRTVSVEPLPDVHSA